VPWVKPGFNLGCAKPPFGLIWVKIYRPVEHVSSDFQPPLMKVNDGG